MADVWWLVSIQGEDAAPAVGDELTLVEFRESWPEAKRRFAELHASGSSVDVFDADGELVRSQDSELSKGRMSAPRVAGLYRWNEKWGHQRVGFAPPIGWRRTVVQFNQRRTGLPGKTNRGPQETE